MRFQTISVHGALINSIIDIFFSQPKLREANVTMFTPEKIKIVRLREELVFDAKRIEVYYVSQDGKEVTVNNTGLFRLFFLVFKE